MPNGVRNHDEGGEPHAGVTHTLFARSGHSKNRKKRHTEMRERDEH